jgi:hypothetical protein
MPTKKEPKFKIAIIQINDELPICIPLRIISPKDIPKPEHQKKHMPLKIKRTLIKMGFRNVTQTNKTKHK